ncbi:hypothetical protein [Clostridium sp. AF22-10]|uniref:hypothetical protein n=1 Tax=Clostridium sp. AF22-10 TaxID=2293004 RepID=UPI001FAA2953
MARGESRKRKPGTPDYRKRFWAAVTAIVVAAGSIGVSHAGFTLPNQAQKQVQMAAAETEPAEQTAKKQVPNAAKQSLELEDAQGIRRRMQRRLRIRASWRVTKRRRAASGVSTRQCMRLRTCSTCVRAVERSMRL